jgi:beta-glucosidase
VVEVRVPVTNSGDRDGREVVQVYASLPGSAVRRAPRELKGFANVAIPAGATAEVVIGIPRAELAYWDRRFGRWVVEGGDYVLDVGASSRDLRTTADSTLGEWICDPRAARLLGQAAAKAAADGGAVGELATDPEMLAFINSLPLNRIARYPGSPFTTELIGELVATVARDDDG